jgi:hypothetical protein
MGGDPALAARVLFGGDAGTCVGRNEISGDGRQYIRRRIRGMYVSGRRRRCGGLWSECMQGCALRIFLRHTIVSDTSENMNRPGC